MLAGRSYAASTPRDAFVRDLVRRVRAHTSPLPLAERSSDQLPEPVPAAVIEFLTTTPAREPVRVGKPLRGELAGIWLARRGTYRILYRVREDPREVIVLRIEHRRDVYRPC